MDLMILGASARAAAFSALRLGLRSVSADLFADVDLASAGLVTKVDLARYPDVLAEFAADQSPTPWLYTGAIENRPDLVDRISERHPLLGNPGPALIAVRDPIALAGSIRDAGLVAPGVRINPVGLPIDGSWLCKPVASGGGRGIHLWRGQRLRTGRSVYFQERINGRSLAAIFVGERATARCLGITRQYVGKAGNQYAYRGSLAPWPVRDEIFGQIERLGWSIVSTFHLAGLFGVDLILRGGQVWPIEVNPRYTASVEILEWAGGRSLMAEHLQAFDVELGSRPIAIRPEGFAAKAIVYAGRSFSWPTGGIDFEVNPARFPEIADIPRPGTSFEAGEPVLTVFARGDSPEECRRNLGTQLLAWRHRQAGWAVGSDLRVDEKEDNGGDQEDAEDGPGEPERLPADPGPRLVP